MSDATTMSHRGLGSEAFGGTPVGNRVAVPAGAREPITVYINGVEQTRAEDYDIADGEIVFREPIYKENLHELNWFRKFGLGLGLFGWYERNESVDIQFQSSAGIRLVSDVPILPAE
ncbi:MAG: hypothetical protein JWO14_3141 [Solirubrobacterales bacterium]|nr:hypothetical protein [Solirubrobacterales bacterium]